jgi:transcriptional regulator GlxA family with amidase domain
MKIAIALFDRFTALDAVGPFQVLKRLPAADIFFISERRGLITDDSGALRLEAPVALADAEDPDIVLVPGGPGSPTEPGELHEWLRAVDQTSTWTTSVCTGSLVLAAAGLLTGRRATTHWLAREELARLGAEPVTERVVFDGKYVTAAGVSAGLDMALALAGRIAGDEAAQAIQLGIEYDPQPPYDAGSESKAPAAVVARVRAGSRFTAPVDVTSTGL